MAVVIEDGTFDSASEAWTCDVTLSDGSNSYTATATDSSAETGADSITVTLNTGTTISNTGTPNTRSNSGAVVQISN